MASDTKDLTPGQRLRNIRLRKGRRGWTQVQLSVRAGVGPNTISDAEGDKKVPQPLTQERIARALGVERTDIWPNGESVKEAS